MIMVAVLLLLLVLLIICAAELAFAMTAAREWERAFRTLQSTRAHALEEAQAMGKCLADDLMRSQHIRHCVIYQARLWKKQAEEAREEADRARASLRRLKARTCKRPKKPRATKALRKMTEIAESRRRTPKARKAAHGA